MGRNFLAGDSKVSERFVVDSLARSCLGGREVLEALEMESRILWNFRLVVVSAAGILSGLGSHRAGR